MGETSIVSSKWRLVEVGRVVLLHGDSPYSGKLATIVEIIDHKRVRGDPIVEMMGVWWLTIGTGIGRWTLLRS